MPAPGSQRAIHYPHVEVERGARARTKRFLLVDFAPAIGRTATRNPPCRGGCTLPWRVVRYAALPLSTVR